MRKSRFTEAQMIGMIKEQEAGHADLSVLDHIADAFCDHSLKGLDASCRRMDTSKERADLSMRLYDFSE